MSGVGGKKRCQTSDAYSSVVGLVVVDVRAIFCPWFNHAYVLPGVRIFPASCVSRVHSFSMLHSSLIDRYTWSYLVLFSLYRSVGDSM